MTDIVDRLLAVEARPLTKDDLPVFPRHWPRDELSVEAANLIVSLREKQEKCKCGCKSRKRVS